MTEIARIKQDGQPDIVIEERLIMLPWEPGAKEILQCPPANWRQHDPHGETALVLNDYGGLSPVNEKEFWDYVYGGQAEELGVL